MKEILNKFIDICILFTPQVFLIYMGEKTWQVMVIWLFGSIVAIFSDRVKNIIFAHNKIKLELHELVNEANATIKNLTEISEPLLIMSLETIVAASLGFSPINYKTAIKYIYNVQKIKRKYQFESVDKSLFRAKIATLKLGEGFARSINNGVKTYHIDLNDNNIMSKLRKYLTDEQNIKIKVIYTDLLEFLERTGDINEDSYSND
ncbi:hypothetical protein FYN05_06945 [Lactobacillus salivarius]|uniref:hypothetical protein n=1 Tax=Ligilactobacillus salivarius TaxID=1624 RepID=UPI00136A10E2|nr:hypothetical protein [Ligilactobacillus salivarius]MYV21538.1 hypothetical protein [Ligilactobacillus salivarius]